MSARVVMVFKLLPKILMLALFALNSELLAIMVHHGLLLIKLGETVFAVILDGVLELIRCLIHKLLVVHAPNIKREQMMLRMFLLAFLKASRPHFLFKHFSV